VGAVVRVAREAVMVRAGIGIVVGVLLAGTAAQAQTITNLTTSAGTDIVFPFAPPLIHFGQTGSPPPPGTFTDSSANQFGGSDFTSFVTKGDSISFESSNVVSGHSVQSYSSTSVVPVMGEGRLRAMRHV